MTTHLQPYMYTQGEDVSGNHIGAAPITAGVDVYGNFESPYRHHFDRDVYSVYLEKGKEYNFNIYTKGNYQNWEEEGITSAEAWDTQLKFLNGGELESYTDSGSIIPDADGTYYLQVQGRDGITRSQAKSATIKSQYDFR